MFLPENFPSLSPLDAALAYAKAGMKVFPCHEKDTAEYKMKAPYIAGGFKSASDDPDQIRQWWATFPNALIGMVTGQEVGLFVVDVDVGPNKHGLQSFEALQLGDLPTWTVKTQGGGIHFYFRYSLDTSLTSGQNVIGEHIDHRANNGYIIAAGSKTVSGGYEFFPGKEPWTVDLLNIPQPILEKLTRSKTKVSPSLPREIESGSQFSQTFEVVDPRFISRYMSYEDAVQQIATGLNLRFVKDHWEGAPCPACQGGTRDRFTLKPDEHGNAWLICNAGCRQGDIWKALVNQGLVDDSSLRREGFRRIEFPDLGRNGPKATLENYRRLLNDFGIQATYDVIGKTEDIVFPGMRGTRENRVPSALTEIASLAARYRLASGRLEQMIFKICDENPVNPVLDWINSEPWDGASRIPALIETIESDEPRLTPILIRKWLLSLMYALTSIHGHSSQGVLVLQGAQGLGKSRWLAKLCPSSIKAYFLAGHVLDPRNKDSVLATTKHWIVELGELDGTFRRSDVAMLKAFLTSSKDVIRKPYGRVEVELPRRTGFAATVNDASFLQDDTGNRRYYTVRCSEINADHDINIQQLWAEVLALVSKGESEYLTTAEAEQLERSNLISMAVSPIEETIRGKFKWNGPLEKYMSSTEVCRAIGIEQPSQYQVRQAAAALRNIKGIQTFDRRKEKTFHMPKLQ